MDLDDSLKLLANQDVRLLLYTMRERPGEGVERRELIQDMLERDGFDGQGRDDLQVALHHNYIPRLEDQGVLEYDETERIVTYEGSEDFEQVLETIRELEKQYEESL